MFRMYSTTDTSQQRDHFSFRVCKEYNGKLSLLPGKPAKLCKEMKYEFKAALLK